MGDRLRPMGNRRWLYSWWGSPNLRKHVIARGGPYWHIKNKDVRYVTVRKPDGQIAHYYLLVNQIWFLAQEE